MEEDQQSPISSPNPVPNPSPQIPKSHNNIPKFVFILFILLLLLASIIFAYFQLSEKKAITLPQKTIWDDFSSTNIGIPLVNNKNGKIYIYNYTKKKMNQSEIQEVRASRLDSVIPSFDMYYSAVIDEKSQEIFLISHESNKTKRIDTNEKVYKINGWSKNSKYLIYSVELPLGPDNQDYLFPKVKYFAFDITSGKTQELPDINRIIEFTPTGIFYERENNYYLFDIQNVSENTLHFDPLSDVHSLGFGYQLDISIDGNKWVYAAGETGNSGGFEYSHVRYSDFPTGESEIIYSSKNWGDNSWPRISPDGNYISLELNGLSIYDTNSKTTSQISTTNRSKWWVDSKNIVMIKDTRDEQFHEFFILNVDTKEEVKINSLLPKSAYEIVNTSPFPQQPEKRLFDLSDYKEFINIPHELTDEFNSSLVGLTCQNIKISDTQPPEYSYTSTYSDGSAYRNHSFTDNEIIAMIEYTSGLNLHEQRDKQFSPDSLACKLEDGRAIVTRSYFESEHYVLHLFLFTDTESDPYHIGPINHGGIQIYSGCSVMQVSRNDEYYFYCGMGDGGYSEFEIQKIVKDKEKEILMKCENSEGSTKCE